MKKLLLIMGDLASGKSTFALKLAKRYDTHLFTKDSIKEVLGDTIGFSNREENIKLSKATQEVMLLIAEEFASLGKDLILESNFRVKELSALHDVALRNGYDVLTLVLRGDINVLHKRFINRMNKENRHPVHLSGSLDVFEIFKSYSESLIEGEIPGKNIYIDSTDFSYQEDETLLKQIDEFME